MERAEPTANVSINRTDLINPSDPGNPGNPSNPSNCCWSQAVVLGPITKMGGEHKLSVTKRGSNGMD